MDLLHRVDIFPAHFGKLNGRSAAVKNRGAHLYSTRLMLLLRAGCEIYSFLAAAEKLRACQTQAVDTLNRHWGPQSAQLHFTEQYRNMKEKLAEHPQLVELARSACLTFRGLPCPNLGLGGWGYHSPYEHITVQAMEK